MDYFEESLAMISFPTPNWIEELKTSDKELAEMKELLKNL